MVHLSQRLGLGAAASAALFFAATSLASAGGPPQQANGRCNTDGWGVTGEVTRVTGPSDPRVKRIRINAAALAAARRDIPNPIWYLTPDGGFSGVMCPGHKPSETVQIGVDSAGSVELVAIGTIPDSSGSPALPNAQTLVPLVLLGLSGLAGSALLWRKRSHNGMVQ